MKHIKFEQIAIAVANSEAAEQWKKDAGLDNSEWSSDVVVAEGYVQGFSEPCVNTAHLQFCYDNGMELELIYYVEGHNYLEHCMNYNHGMVPPFVSHIGSHVDSIEEEKQKLGFPVLQEVTTISHTNPFLVNNKRQYKYCIFDTMGNLGFNLKLIERIEYNG
jgi:hypothetical protein